MSDANLDKPAGDFAELAATSRFLRTVLLSRIAHDIRAPAGVVAGALHELESALGTTAAEHRVWLTMLNRGLKRLLRLADRLSMVAELEERPIQVARVRTDVGEMVKKSIEGATFVQSRSSVKVEALIDEGVFASVDARWLEPALVDVLCNAIRFAHRNVRVQVSAVTDASGSPTKASISIEDDGAGVAPEAMATLFHRLVSRPSGSGVGLSLSVAHAVVIGHNGALRVEPSTLAPGRGEARGARFVIEIDDVGGA